MGFINTVICFAVVFTRHFTDTRACHMNITSLNGTINILTPPAKQTNSTGYTCKWNIQLMKVDTPRHVELRFTSFDIAGIMPECFSGNYIELFLGCNPSKSIGKFCGKLSMPVVYSFDHCLQIRLIVASDFRFEGSSLLDGVPYFTAVFNQRLRTKALSQNYYGCGKDYYANARYGNVFSPHWPLPYPRYVDCVWHVTTRKDYNIKLLFFDFDVRSTNASSEADFVEVRPGRRLVTKSKQCGRKDPFSLTIEGDSVFIQFKSNAEAGNRGFMAGFVTYSAETVDFQPQVLIMLAVIFSTLLLFAGKALVKKMLEKRRLKRKANLDQSARRYWTRSVTPISHDHSVGESTAKSDFLGRKGASTGNCPVKNVTFETAETESKPSPGKEYSNEDLEQETVC